MSTGQSAPAPIRKRMRVLLIVSLALNIAVAGIVAGFLIRGGPAGGPPRSIDMAVGPLGEALPREDRRAIGLALRGDPAVRALSRENIARERERLAEILVAEPFDRAALSEALLDRRAQLRAVQDAATELLLDRVAAMTPEERRAFAEALRGERGR